MNTMNLDNGMMEGGAPSPCENCRHHEVCNSPHSRLTLKQQEDMHMRCMVRGMMMSLLSFVVLVLLCAIVGMLTSCSTSREVERVAQVQQVTSEAHVTADNVVKIDSTWTHDLSHLQEFTWTQTVTYYDTLGRVTAVSEQVITGRDEHKDVTTETVTEHDSAHVTIDTTYVRNDSLQVEHRQERGDAARTGWQSFLYTMRTSWRWLMLLALIGVGYVILRKIGKIK